MRWAASRPSSATTAARGRGVKDGIIARRGAGQEQSQVAVARELLTLVYYGLRDGEIRRAIRPGQAA